MRFNKSSELQSWRSLLCPGEHDIINDNASNIVRLRQRLAGFGLVQLRPERRPFRRPGQRHGYQRRRPWHFGHEQLEWWKMI